MSLAQLAFTPLSGLILFLVNLQQAFASKQCVCLGDILTYECTAVGAGSTVWTGSAFNCSASSNEISLLHNRFSSTEGDYGSCNNGAIVARSLSVDGNNYTSQLNVTVTSDIAEKIIMCLHYNYHNNSNQLLMVHTISPTGPFLPPNEVWINNVNFLLQREVTFSWSPVALDCPAIHYNILASNCGSCPATTNHTNVTCTDIPTNSSTCTCTFAVQTVTCGNITGNISDPISVNFYATEPSRVSMSIPLSTENQNLSMQNLDTTEIPTTMFNTAANTVNTISISTLGAALAASIVVSVTVIAVILRRSKARIKELELQLTNSSTLNEPMYEDLSGALPPVSAINTQDNIAYGHTQALTITTQA